MLTLETVAHPGESGRFFLRFVVDEGNEVAESNELDNHDEVFIGYVNDIGILELTAPADLTVECGNSTDPDDLESWPTVKHRLNSADDGSLTATYFDSIEASEEPYSWGAVAPIRSGTLVFAQRRSSVYCQLPAELGISCHKLVIPCRVRLTDFVEAGWRRVGSARPEGHT